MSDDDVALEMSMPLDSDGFLRRECPTCEREFKWFHTPAEEGSAAPVIDGGYFCPYCGVQAETNTWLTQAGRPVARWRPIHEPISGSWHEIRCRRKQPSKSRSATIPSLFHPRSSDPLLL